MYVKTENCCNLLCPLYLSYVSAQPLSVVPVASYLRPTWCLSLLVMYTLSSAGDTQISYRNDPCTELQLEPQLEMELELELELELDL